MADFNIRTDAVDVEQIMRQIRARIQEKRGVDYTEQQIQELASVKLERFLEPKGVRSDLVEQFKRRERKIEPFQPVQYAVDANDLYGSQRFVVRAIRKLFNPFLKLLLNANRLVQVLHQQTEINLLYEKQFHQLREKSQQRDEIDGLYYELVHNLVLELTRLGIENRNLKMRLESLSSRMDFDERRARALEGVVQYRPGTGPARDATRQAAPAAVVSTLPAAAQVPESASQEASSSGEQPDAGTARRRRRRRRGRRGGRGRGPSELAGHEAPGEVASADESATPPHGDPTREVALDTGSEQADDMRDSNQGTEDDAPDTSAQ